jgi:hypothetical protein
MGEAIAVIILENHTTSVHLVKGFVGHASRVRVSIPDNFATTMPSVMDMHYPEAVR